MTLNVFEGARRIALLVAVAWVLGWVAYAIFSEPSVRLRYVVDWPGRAPVLTEECANADATEYLSRSTNDVPNLSVILCFKAHPADNGEMLIPYAPTDEPGRFWMEAKYASKVWQYTRSAAPQFQLGPDGYAAAGKARDKAISDQWWSSAKFILFGVVGWWVLVSVVGWIVRGFLGIPRGKDHRPTA